MTNNRKTSALSRPVTRRRALSIGALAGAATLLPGWAFAGSAMRYSWHGTALGAEASITIAHHHEGQAADLIDMCRQELKRLEAVFSLYLPTSALSRLNRDGALAAPPPELVSVLDRCSDVYQLSGGAFDPTIQPLWSLYADHFSHDGAAPSGPPVEALSDARARIGFRHVHYSTQKIYFARPDMAVTLNGIAQGFITARIAARLRAAGSRNILVNMGEIAASGRRPDGSPWQVGLADPNLPATVWRTVQLDQRALASSGGYESRFDASGRHHHLFDPSTARSALGVKGASVSTRDATTADALSTALVVMDPGRAQVAIGAIGDTTAWLTRADGSRLILRS